MGNEKETFRLAEILVKSYREELLPEEREMLDRWLQESGHNRELYNLYATESFLKQKIKESSEIDWEADYTSFIRKYPLRRNILYSKWMRYAAFFVLPLALGIIIWSVVSMKMDQPLSKSVDNNTKTGPVLILAGGQKILLTDSVRMEEIDGTLVAGENGGLTYERKDSTAGNEDLIYNKLEIPRGAEYFLTLADGTKIWLNSESVLRYPVNFTGEKREVFIEGEAFFKVTRDSLHPFIVHAANTQIEVLGTEFNVRNYKDEQHVATTLVEGSVCLTSEKGNHQAILKPGEQGNTDLTTGDIVTGKVDLYLYTAWKDARFVFRNTRMEELLNTLSRWYDLEVFYQNNAVKDICFTGDMTRMADFRQLLNIIEANERVRFTIHNRVITVSLK